MLADREVTRNELFAIGATLHALARAFAYLYTVLQAIEPAASRPWSTPVRSAAGAHGSPAPGRGIAIPRCGIAQVTLPMA